MGVDRGACKFHTLPSSVFKQEASSHLASLFACFFSPARLSRKVSSWKAFSSVLDQSDQYQGMICLQKVQFLIFFVVAEIMHHLF
jgi:hypothetical protein